MSMSVDLALVLYRLGSSRSHAPPRPIPHSRFSLCLSDDEGAISGKGKRELCRRFVRTRGGRTEDNISEEGNKERGKSAPRKFRKRRFPQRNDYDRKGGGRSEAASERWLLGRSHCQVFPSALGIHNSSSSAVCVKSAETKPARRRTTLANMTANVRASTPKVAETTSIFGNS